jgi:PAS domain S-box-containing protein
MLPRHRLLRGIGWAQVQQVFDSLPVRVAMHDRKHCLFYVNTEWSRFHSASEAAVLGRTIAEVHDEQIFSEIRPWAERALAGEAGEWHGWIELPRGRRYVLRTFAALRDTAGAIEGYLLFTRDLTDQQEIERGLAEQSAARIASEAELERQREALQQSEKMAAFGSLLAGVAHELNNPLAIVIGNALMLAEDLEGSALAERAQRVQAAAERCGRIVRSFLAMARQHKAEMQPTTVRSLIDDALQLLAYPMRTSGVTVVQDIAPDLPAVLCDPDQMIQVLSNLLTNARHALEDRPLPRRVRLSAHAEGEWVEFEVADNGPGIADDIRSRIFDPFFTTKPVGSGTGVGLAVSRGLVEAFGGSLVLAPSEGEGACFVIRLPRARDTSQLSGSGDAAELPQRLTPPARTARRRRTGCRRGARGDAAEARVSRRGEDERRSGAGGADAA